MAPRLIDAGSSGRSGTKTGPSIAEFLPPPPPSDIRLSRMGCCVNTTSLATGPSAARQSPCLVSDVTLIGLCRVCRTGVGHRLALYMINNYAIDVLDRAQHAEQCLSSHIRAGQWPDAVWHFGRQRDTAAPKSKSASASDLVNPSSSRISRVFQPRGADGLPGGR